MTANNRHAALVERLQREVIEKPLYYRAKLAALAMAGYAVLLLVLTVGLGLPVLVVARLATTGQVPGYEAAYLVAIPGVLGVLVLRALWIRFERPDGVLLKPGEAPALEHEVERLRLAAGAPPLHGIVIDGDLNAAAASVPRLLGLAGHRHYLVLGLPLLRALDRAELAAVIAHEFGHFSQENGRFTGWIYRVRLSWYRVLDALAGRGVIGAALLARFYAWYVPYFNAYSFALARHEEYRADAVAARVAGAEVAASTLIRVELAQRRLSREVWSRLPARMRAQRQPLHGLQTQIARVLAAPFKADLPRLLVGTDRATDVDDTHPPLPQRLAALTSTPALRPSPGRAGADEFLGASLARIERALEDHWRGQIAARWEEVHRSAQAERERLDVLESRAELSAAEKLEHARLVESLRPDFDALRLYDRVLAEQPGSAMAHYRAGMLRLGEGEWERGLDHLRQAMALDAGAIRPVLDELAELENAHEMPQAAAQALAALRAQYATHARTLDEREGVEEADALLAHDLDAAALAMLAQAFSAEARIARAWLARKRMDLAEEAPHFVILLDWRGSVAGEQSALARISARLALPGSHSLFTGANERQLAANVRAACGKPVYTRGRG